MPNYRENEDSSLIYMVDDLISRSKHQKSGFYLNDYKSLSIKLQELEKLGQKTSLGVNTLLRNDSL